MPKSKASNRKSPARAATTYTRLRFALIGLGVFTIGASAAAALALYRRAARRRDGHAAPDLAADRHPDGSGRAPDAFRPDGDAPIPDSEREALRPATVPGPGRDDNVEELNGSAIR